MDNNETGFIELARENGDDGIFQGAGWMALGKINLDGDRGAEGVKRINARRAGKERDNCKLEI